MSIPLPYEERYRAVMEELIIVREEAKRVIAGQAEIITDLRHQLDQLRIELKQSELGRCIAEARLAHAPEVTSELIPLTVIQNDALPWSQPVHLLELTQLRG